MIFTWLVDRHHRRLNKKSAQGPAETSIHWTKRSKSSFSASAQASGIPSTWPPRETTKSKHASGCSKALGRDQVMKELLSSGSFDEIWQRAYRVMTTSGQLVHHIESSDLSRALDSPGRKQLFSQALAILLWSEDTLEGPFRAHLLKMLLEIKSAKLLPVMTYFLFLPFSDIQILLNMRDSVGLARVIY